jgi:preprotein translocase subunit YajC
MARVNIFLIIVALIGGTIGCASPTLAQYNLTISSTGGGSVTTPGEGTFTYDEHEVVELVAEADEGYRFVEWTGDVGTIADVNAATIIITMNGDYTITANFVAVAAYYLTISSTAGGSVTTPGERTFSYHAGTVVNLVASPDSGYRFVEWTGAAGTIADVSDATTTITMNGDYTITANFEYTPMVATGGLHTVGLEADGTVVAVGRNDHGQCDVGGWTGIVQVAAGYDHTVGLKSDGTVVAVGRNDYGRCDVGGWTVITQVAAGVYHTVGLKSDGTVVTVGWNHFGQCNVDGWAGIVQVAAGAHHTVGLKNDGTVVGVGRNDETQRDVGDWTDIIWVAAGSKQTVGLKSDGAVVAVGWNYFGECDVGGWDLN